MREPSDNRPLQDVWGLLAYLAWRLRCRAAKTAALWATAAALTGLAAVVAVVAAVGLPPSVVFVALGGGAAAVGVAAGLAYGARPSAMYLARLVERQRPELKEALVTLVELAADTSSDRSMQTALARRAGRILARDPPHAFLPDISWRRPGWALVAGAVTLGAVLWMAKGTAVVPWLPGAEAGTPQVAGASQGDEGSRALARAGADEGSEAVAGAGEADVRSGGGPARAAGGAAGDGAGEGASQGDEGSDDVAQAGAADAGSGAGASRAAGGAAGDCAGEGASQGAGGSEAVARAGEADARGGEAAGDGPSASPPAAEGGVQPSGNGSGAGGAAGERSPPRGASAGPPLPQRNPSEAAPENVLDTMRRQKPLMGEDDRPPDEGESPRKFLGQMGVSTAEDRRYTTSWSHGAQGSGAGPAVTLPPDRVRALPGQVDGRVLNATGDADVQPVVVPADAGAGERGALIHAAEARVSPRLRAAVRAYFERIGRLGAGE